MILNVCNSSLVSAADYRQSVLCVTSLICTCAIFFFLFITANERLPCLVLPPNCLIAVIIVWGLGVRSAILNYWLLKHISRQWIQFSSLSHHFCHALKLSIPCNKDFTALHDRIPLWSRFLLYVCHPQKQYFGNETPSLSNFSKQWQVSYETT